ncbi:ADP-ribose pyrophosphatase [Methylobacillus rhizosphaerae]|uniref:GDP-mannose pyrophosphatase n=1 Tax=Methylobacillus rhizosphaerae TaxID=551994 RepID=A0A239AM07_9PROT|nr:NUDIX hydrolase [Methylobacillus rhizosphaerae]SNR96352.1 ADP-ribose pyrophosphatase [Methylobacillus rhizosphaerae]
MNHQAGDDQDLAELTLSSETIAEGGMLLVKRDQVRVPSGAISQREYVIHPGAVLVIPILDNGKLLLERQFRYPLSQVFIELPAGKIDAGEPHLETGKRELLEETGYTATDWVYLGLVHPCIGYSNEVIHMYLARGLSAGKHQRDEDEALQLFEASLDECMTMVAEGTLTDGKTIVALLHAEKFLGGVWTGMRTE